MRYRVVERVAALAVSVVLLVGAAGCSSQPSDAESETEITTATTLADVPPVVEADVLCTTPYFAPVRPDYWDDRIQVQAVDGVGSYTLRFTVSLNGKEAALFWFTFGGSGGGYRLGQMTDANGRAVDVFSELGSFEVGDVWTADEVQTLTALQDCVNEILHQIQTAENFTE